MWSYAKAESRNAESINAMKRRPRKRMIFKLLLFLLAGVIINVAVAWGFALTFACDPFLAEHAAEYLPDRIHSRKVIVCRLRGTEIASLVTARGGLGLRPKDDSVSRILPEWINQGRWLPTQVQVPEHHVESVLLEAHGWPYFALTSGGD